MPATVTGTSSVGNQTLINRTASTAFTTEITITSLPTDFPKRYGYAYLIVDNPASPFQGRIVARFPLYAPGFFAAFTNQYNGTGATYTLKVTWNKSGLNYQAKIN